MNERCNVNRSVLIDRATLSNYCAALYGWTVAHASEVVNECLDRFLRLKFIDNDWDSTKHSASTEVDQVWHVFILHTKMYAAFCGDTFIHHDPGGALHGAARERRYKNTLTRYSEVFGREPPPHIWPPIHIVWPGGLARGDLKSDAVRFC